MKKLGTRCQFSFIITGALIALLIPACQKQPESSGTTDSSPLVGTNRVDIVTETNVPAAVTSQINDITATNAPSLTQALQSLPAASSNAAAAIKETTEAANQRFVSLVQEVENFIKQSKFAEAAQLMTEFSKISLTPEQQQLVDKLKAQIEKGLSSKAGQELQKGINNILGGSK